MDKRESSRRQKKPVRAFSPEPVNSEPLTKRKKPELTVAVPPAPAPSNGGRLRLSKPVAKPAPVVEVKAKVTKKVEKPTAEKSERKPPSYKLSYVAQEELTERVGVSTRTRRSAGLNQASASTSSSSIRSPAVADTSATDSNASSSFTSANSARLSKNAPVPQPQFVERKSGFGRLRKPPPSREYPGHQDVIITPSSSKRPSLSPLSPVKSATPEPVKVEEPVSPVVVSPVPKRRTRSPVAHVASEPVVAETVLNPSAPNESGSSPRSAKHSRPYKIVHIPPSQLSERKSGSGRVKKPPPSREYPGHKDGVPSSSLKRPSLPPFSPLKSGSPESLKMEDIPVLSPSTRSVRSPAVVESADNSSMPSPKPVKHGRSHKPSVDVYDSAMDDEEDEEEEELELFDTSSENLDYDDEEEEEDASISSPSPEALDLEFNEMELAAVDVPFSEFLTQKNSALESSVVKLEETENCFFLRKIMMTCLQLSPVVAEKPTLAELDSQLNWKAQDTPSYLRVVTRYANRIISHFIEAISLNDSADATLTPRYPLTLISDAIANVEPQYLPALKSTHAIVVQQLMIEATAVRKPDPAAFFFVSTMELAKQYKTRVSVLGLGNVIFCHEWLVQRLDFRQLCAYLNLLRFLEVTLDLCVVLLEGASPECAGLGPIFADLAREPLDDPYIRLVLHPNISRSDKRITILAFCMEQSDDGNKDLFASNVDPICHGLVASNIQVIANPLVGKWNEDESTFTLCALATLSVESVMKEAVEKYPDDYIFVLGVGYASLFLFQSLPFVEGIAGVIAFGFPSSIDEENQRGVAGDVMNTSYCPSLLIIGSEAKNAKMHHLPKIVSNATAPIGIITVGHADDALTVNSEYLKHYGLTQACVNRLLLCHIIDFVELTVEKFPDYRPRRSIIPEETLDRIRSTNGEIEEEEDDDLDDSPANTAPASPSAAKRSQTNDLVSSPVAHARAALGSTLVNTQLANSASSMWVSDS